MKSCANCKLNAICTLYICITDMMKDRPFKTAIRQPERLGVVCSIWQSIAIKCDFYEEEK